MCKTKARTICYKTVGCRIRDGHVWPVVAVVRLCHGADQPWQYTEVCAGDTLVSRSFARGRSALALYSMHPGVARA